jgi:hypothetical protein
MIQETWLPSRSLAMDVLSDSDIPVSKRHATILWTRKCSSEKVLRFVSSWAQFWLSAVFVVYLNFKTDIIIGTTYRNDLIMVFQFLEFMYLIQIYFILQLMYFWTNYKFGPNLCLTFPALYANLPHADILRDLHASGNRLFKVPKNWSLQQSQSLKIHLSNLE